LALLINKLTDFDDFVTTGIVTLFHAWLVEKMPVIGGGFIMGSIIFEVSGAFANFKLENDEITKYEFAYSVSDSKYAKGSKDKRELVIKGSVSRTLARNETAMKEIREWAKEKYKDPSYYSHVKITAIYRDVVVREITVRPDRAY